MKEVKHYIYRLIDNHWTCINLQDEKRVLCDLLSFYGFGDLSESVTYCLAENSKFKMKYRVYGGNINIYITVL